MDFDWSLVPLVSLRAKWTEGGSASKIAAWLTETYWHPVSRNAAMGKLHRLGFPRKIPRDKLPTRSPKVNGVKIRKKPWQIMRPEVIEPPTGQEVSFADLKLLSCRYIPGSPQGIDTMYCGDPVIGVDSYCPHHFRLCYRTTQRTKPSGALLGAAAGHPPSESGGGPAFNGSAFTGWGHGPQFPAKEGSPSPCSDHPSLK